MQFGHGYYFVPVTMAEQAHSGGVAQFAPEYRPPL
jgi:hypothetical protein